MSGKLMDYTSLFTLSVRNVRYTYGIVQPAKEPHIKCTKVTKKQENAGIPYYNYMAASTI